MLIEFLGLPGVGKSTIASHLATEFQRRGIEPLVTADFVDWLARLGYGQKLLLLTKDLPSVFWHFRASMKFGLSLRPMRASCIRRLLLIPFVNCCFDAYLDTHPGRIVIMDQANMQMLWSLGSFSFGYDAVALERACRETSSKHRPFYVYVSASQNVVAERLRSRATRASRFDSLGESQLFEVLSNSTQLLESMRDVLITYGEKMLVVDAKTSPEVNADLIYGRIGALRPLERESAS
jgi:shikimate kinase